MPDSAKKPCRICRKWFRPDVRVGKRQRSCGRTECQQVLKKKRLAKWRARNPDYSIGVFSARLRDSVLRNLLCFGCRRIKRREDSQCNQAIYGGLTPYPLQSSQ